MFVGIDPGAKGSLCALDPGRKNITCLSTVQAPHLIYDWLNALSPIRMIAIENVHAIYGTSAGSNFKFGYNVGMLHGIVGSTRIGMDTVQPKIWQKQTGILFKKGMTVAQKKKVVAAKVIQLYPEAELYGPKGGLLDGRADALMIAHYLTIKYGGS